MSNNGGPAASGLGFLNLSTWATQPGGPPPQPQNGPPPQNPLLGRADPNETVVCVMCGGVCRPTVLSAPLHFQFQHTDWMHPFLIKAKPGFLEWCKEPSSATAYRREDGHILDVILVDAFRGGALGFYNATIGIMAIDTRDSEMYLPIHGPCVDLAKLFCRYQSKFSYNFRDISDDGGVPTSIAHLYEIWMKRALMIEPGRLGPLHSPIDEPNGYFGAVLFKNLRQYAEYCEANREPLQEVDPSGDYNMTTKFLFATLTRTADKDMTPKPEHAELANRISALPNDIVRHIEDELEPWDDLGPAQLVCNRMLTPTWWKAKLYKGDLAPWLFDLPTITDPNGIMDWELLCRQLGQRDLNGPNGILNGHKHLQNRYRIWRVLDSSRLGQMGPRRA
ncbi:hypothetical protein M434DRAFT_388604 [Hypoxylon sp. CO27-5]|nr:hypothetical protein M434DRAFT_388604 [Hypoxylon sp. CO27-5]